MADTDFGALTTEQKTVWSRKLWREAMSRSFLTKFLGKDHNAMIQHITELTKDERGDSAVMTLVPELVGDGVVGDYELEGNEEEIKAFDKKIGLDQLRNANRSKGRMADQRSIVQFRSTSKSVLSNWYADRIDQVAFLTMSGIPYTKFTNGADRPVLATGKNLGDLAFASDVAAPSAGRHLRWASATNEILEGDTTAITADDKLSYEALVRARAYMKERHVRGIPNSTMPSGDLFHVFVTPSGMADLRLDPKYRENVLYSAPRTKNGEMFTGAVTVMADGFAIHEYNHVYHTTGAADGSKWGAAGGIDGQRVLICGAQAMGMTDIGLPEWVEDDFDYKNKMGISISKIMGFLKPQFKTTEGGRALSSTEEDFGICVLDTAI